MTKSSTSRRARGSHGAELGRPAVSPPERRGIVAPSRVSAEDFRMAKDQQGLPLAGASESAAAFDRAVADYWGLRAIRSAC